MGESNAGSNPQDKTKPSYLATNRNSIKQQGAVDRTWTSSAQPTHRLSLLRSSDSCSPRCLEMAPQTLFHAGGHNCPGRAAATDEPSQGHYCGATGHADFQKKGVLHKNGCLQISGLRLRDLKVFKISCLVAFSHCTLCFLSCALRVAPSPALVCHWLSSSGHHCREWAGPLPQALGRFWVLHSC